MTGKKYMVDTSSQGVIRSNLSNYVYLRGKTSREVRMKTRLFCIPNQALLYPTLWTQYPVYESNGRDIAYRFIDSSNLHATDSNRVSVSGGFNVSNPPPLPDGSDHYCLVAEAKDANDASARWPHEDVGIKTTIDLYRWIRNNIYLIQRNINFETYKGENYEEWKTAVSLPSKLHLYCVVMALADIDLS